MKLITKASRIFLITSLASLLISTLVGIWAFHKMLGDEVTQHLLLQQEKVEEYVSLHRSLPRNQITLTDSIWYRKVQVPGPSYIRDTIQYNAVERAMLDYREIGFNVAIGADQYAVSISKPMYESEEVEEVIGITLFTIVFIVLTGVLLANYYVSRKLLQPFYDTLAILSRFKIAQKDPITFASTDTFEFQELQHKLFTLTQKVRSDYQSLKSFTENASHELQTPLSVIGANLELLLQGDNLEEGQLQQINLLIIEIGKVSKLNQTLLLLTKIENRQFDSVEVLGLSSAIMEKLLLWEVWIKHKDISLERIIASNIDIQINAFLLDVLLNNLLGNAIKHNEQGGIIRVSLSSSTLEISNSGKPLTTPVEILFNRFQKGSSHNGSLGLGLSIVKEICVTYGYKIEYVNEGQVHKIRVDFKDHL